MWRSIKLISLFLIFSSVCMAATVRTGGGGGSSGGSGTINSGTANQVAYYAATGTTISGNSGFIFNGTNVGIGTIFPQSKLDVAGSDSGTTITNASAAMAAITNTDTTANNFSDLAFCTTTSTGTQTCPSKVVGINNSHTAGAASGILAFVTQNAGTAAEKMRILANGNVGIGTTAPNAILNIADTSSAVPRGVLVNQFSADTGGGTFIGRKSRGASIGTGTIVQNGDDLLSYRGYGYDGATYQPAAAMFASVDATPGAGDMPGRLTFFTTPDGSTTLTERMRIDNTGNVGIGTTIPDATLKVVAGTSTLMKLVNTSASSSVNGAGISGISDDGAALASGDRLGFYTFGGSLDSIHTTTNSSGMFAFATGAWSGSSAPTDLEFETTPSGTLTRSERMRITAAGNVGIATANPQALLEIKNAGGVDIRMTNTSDNQVWRFGMGAGSGVPNNVFTITDQTAAASPRLIIDLNGNVGLGGDISPDFKLEVPGTFGVSSSISGDGDRLIVNSSGNVGIGTITPGATLDVQGTLRLDGTGANSFRIQAASNQACTTTCTTGKAIVGLDQGTLGVVLPSLVGPSDATADQCLCGS